MKSLVLFIPILMVFQQVYCQDDLIKWNKGVQLQWSDFKAKTDVTSPFAAMAAVGVYYNYHYFSNGTDYKITFDIYSAFDRTKSWGKKENQSPYILKHEQLHFDITELVRRKFKHEVENYPYSSNYKNEINTIFTKYSQELSRLQQKYDEQTAHSKNKLKQKEWENLVQEALLR